MNILIKFGKSGKPILIKNQSKLAKLGFDKDLNEVFINPEINRDWFIEIQSQDSFYEGRGCEFGRGKAFSLPKNGIVRIALTHYSTFSPKMVVWVDVEKEKVVTPTPEMVEAYKNKRVFDLY